MINMLANWYNGSTTSYIFIANLGRKKIYRDTHFSTEVCSYFINIYDRKEKQYFFLLVMFDIFERL